MGLDMYLSAKLYIGGNYSHSGVSGKIDIKSDPLKYDHKKNKFVASGKSKTIVSLKSMETVEEITFHAAYWRKANAIHNYFVQQVQDGVDECQESYVPREKLKELVDLCERTLAVVKSSPQKIIKVHTGWGPDGDTFSDVLVYDVDENLIRNLLPTSEGFFFGSQNYNRWYVEGLEKTVKTINGVLSNPQFEDCEFYYRASW